MRQLLLILTLSGLIAGEPELGLGHQDFIPTPTRPVGYLGDGSGQWPGATPVTEWDQASGTNIVWKAEVPAYSTAGSCIVVGDRVFSLAERCWLLCHDAATGRELWRRAVVPQADLLDEETGKTLIAHLQRHAETLGDYCLCADTGTNNKGQQGAMSFVQEQIGGKDEAFNAWIERMVKLRSTPMHQQDDLLIVNMGEGHNYYTNSQMEAMGLAMRLAGWSDFQAFFEARNTAIWTGATFAPPVSDGTHVYVRMGGAGLACYDLEGVQRWTTWLDQSNGASVAPIFLYGDLLYAPIDDWALVFDKRTGRLRTDIKGSFTPKNRDGTPGKLQTKHGAIPTGSGDLGHQAWAFLPWKYQGEDVFLGRSHLIRAATAEVIKPVTGYLHAAAVLRGDKALSSKGSYGGKEGIRECDILEGENCLNLTEVTYHQCKSSWWSVGEGHGWAISTGTCPHMYLMKLGAAGKETLRVDAGKAPNKFGIKPWPHDGYPAANMPTVAGKFAFGTSWVGQTVVVDLTSNPPSAVGFNQTQGSFDSYPQYQGNRIFMRAGVSLYCLGDPSQPWVNPKSWDVPLPLGDLSHEEGDALARRLGSRRAAERLAAARAIAGKGQAAAVLAALAKEDHREVALALGRALGQSKDGNGLEGLLASTEPAPRIGALQAIASGAGSSGMVEPIIAAGTSDGAQSYDRAYEGRLKGQALAALGPEVIGPAIQTRVEAYRKAGKDPKGREAAMSGMVSLFAGLSAMGTAGKPAAPAAAEFVQMVLTATADKKSDWPWGVFTPALLAVSRSDPDLARPLVNLYLDCNKNDRCGQWPSKNHRVMALEACDATNAAEVVPLIGKLTDWGKNINLVSAMVQIAMKAEPAQVAEKALPVFKAALDEVMKDSNQGKKGCAIWAYYRAGGKRQPLDWKPGGWKP